MTANQESSHVEVLAARKVARDQADGYDRGYSCPYPKDKEKIILANIEKVSPAFVQGYREGKAFADREEWLGHYDPEDFPDYK
ncbi:MAG: hypothetical protein RIQ41_232 [Candidatus Parcubacteria bacterium]|jgi:hypothetical protein